VFVSWDQGVSPCKKGGNERHGKTDAKVTGCGRDGGKVQGTPTRNKDWKRLSTKTLKRKKRAEPRKKATCGSLETRGGESIPRKKTPNHKRKTTPKKKGGKGAFTGQRRGSRATGQDGQRSQMDTTQIGKPCPRCESRGEERKS